MIDREMSIEQLGAIVCQALKDAGIDALTGGNHSLDKKEAVEILNDVSTWKILRPENLIGEKRVVNLEKLKELGWNIDHDIISNTLQLYAIVIGVSLLIQYYLGKSPTDYNTLYLKE